MQQKQARKAGRPSPEETENKRRAVIAAALEEFSRMGFHGASLRLIAQQALVSSRTLYNYYPDKIALFNACLELSGRLLLSINPDPADGLHRRLVTHAAAMQKQLFSQQAMQVAILVYREAGGVTELRRLARIQFERYQVAPVAAILRDCGIDSDRSSILAKQFVVMAFGEWQRRLLFGGPPMTPEEMDAHASLVTGIFLNGIGEPDEGSGKAPAPHPV